MIEIFIFLPALRERVSRSGKAEFTTTDICTVVWGKKGYIDIFNAVTKRVAAGCITTITNRGREREREREFSTQTEAQ